MSYFIAPRLQGRTGNVMFQIANAYAKSLEYSIPLIVPSEESAVDHLSQNILRNFKFEKIDYNILDNYKTIESTFHYQDLEAPSYDKPTRYVGWFQSEKYFKKYYENIRNAYYPTDEFINKIHNDFNYIDDDVCAINVRRGDYLHFPTRHPVVTKDYIIESLKLVPKCKKYFILSDDILWCKENLKIDNSIFIENYWDWKGLWLMSQCTYFIISNSTYSWWGAYLSKKPNKKVIAPSTWFGPDIPEKIDDIYCDGWIKVDTKYSDGKIILNI